MSYQWPVAVEDLFAERSLQMVNTGLLAEDVEATRLAIKNMWSDAPGGWVHEWSKLGAAYTADSPQSSACDTGERRLGISMGGYFSAYSGLTNKVDASIVVGGPVDTAFAPNRHWQFGMADILGNALGLESQPSADELSARCAGLSLRALLEQDENAPMLVINGADDIHVPQRDTLVFEGRKNTQVELLPDTGHCATSKFPEVMATIVGWCGQQLS